MATSASKQKRQALARPRDTADRRLVEAALEIVERRATTLLRLHNALVRGEDAKALALARKLCGLDEQKAKVVKAGT